MLWGIERRKNKTVVTISDSWHVMSRKYILLPWYVCTAQGISHSALRPVKIILILLLFVLTLTCSSSTVPDALCDQQVLLSLTSADDSHWLQAFLRNVTESYNMY